LAKKAQGRQVFTRFCFVLYAALMIWLLFFRTRYAFTDSYWDRMQLNMNLHPLETIKRYWHVLVTPGLEHYVNHAVINLVGNVVMFVPLGAFLPAIWPGLRRFWKTLPLSALVICCVEVLQLVLLVGSCDVDDLILNLAGVWLGYGIFRITRKK